MSIKDAIITKYNIIEKEPVTHDTSRFRFAVPAQTEFKYLPGDHIRIHPNPQNPVEFKQKFLPNNLNTLVMRHKSSTI